MSDVTREHLSTFWALIDELLNVLLFLLIGFEILAVEFTRVNVLQPLPVLPHCSRLVSVVVPTPSSTSAPPIKLGGIAVLTGAASRHLGRACAGAPATPFRACF